MHSSVHEYSARSPRGSSVLRQLVFAVRATAEFEGVAAETAGRRSMNFNFVV